MKNLKKYSKIWVLFSILALSCTTGGVKKGGVQKLLSEGIAEYDAGNYNDALKKFEKASELAPNDPEVYYWQGKTLLAMRETLKAQGVLRKALSLNPSKDLREKIERLLANLEVEPSLEQPAPPEEEEPEIE